MEKLRFLEIDGGFEKQSLDTRRGLPGRMIGLPGRMIGLPGRISKRSGLGLGFRFF